MLKLPWRNRPGNLCRVLIRSPRRLRLSGELGGPLAGGCALVALVAIGTAGCTAVTGGDATVNASDAPVYRTSVSVSSSQSVASSSARESERQASLTTQAVHTTCETLATTSADAIDAVNAYVTAFNREGGDMASTEGPAVDALEQSAEAVDGSITDIVPMDLRDAFTAWVDNAHETADAITKHAAPGQFNQIIGALNDARSKALRLCDATYK